MPSFARMFISILYMFRAAMCPQSGELLYQCDTCFMALCVDDRLVCRSICWFMALCVDDRLVCRSICWLMSLCVDDRLVCRSICWFMALCVDDRLVYMSICSCIPDGHLHKVT